MSDTESPRPLEGRLQVYYSGQVELVARDLYQKHTRVWVDASWRIHKHPVDRTLLGRVPTYHIRRNGGSLSSMSIEQWMRHGGVAIKHFQPRPFFNDSPRSPAVILNECPLSMEALEARSINASAVLVVRVPSTWEIHEKFVDDTHPGALECAQFKRELDYLHQRTSDDHSEITKVMAHDSNTVAVDLGEIRGAGRMGRAMGVMPDAGPYDAQCVRLAVMPQKSDELTELWHHVDHYAPEVAGWKLVTDDLLPGDYNWKFHLVRLARMGFVRLGPSLVFLRVDKLPDYDAAQAQRLAAIERLREVQRMLGTARYYAVDHVQAPLRKRLRRRKSPAGEECGNLERTLD